MNRNKKQAIKELKARRARGEKVKLFRCSGVYCQPGRGLVSFLYYEFRAEG